MLCSITPAGLELLRTVEEPLRKTGIAPIVVLDVDGKPVNTITP